MVKIMPMVMLVATQNTEDPDDGAGDDDADGGKSENMRTTPRYMIAERPPNMR